MGEVPFTCCALSPAQASSLWLRHPKSKFRTALTRRGRQPMGSENLTPVATLIGYPASKPAAEHRSPRLQARRGAAVRDRAGSARGRAAVGPQPTFEPLPAPD